MKKIIFTIIVGLFSLPMSLTGQIINDYLNSDQKKQTVNEYNGVEEDFKKLKNLWGKSTLNSDFDSILSELLQYALDSTMAVHNIIGASASLILPEKGTWKGVYGMSNPSTKDSIKSDMLFGIGSCTKIYVAAVLLKLAEKGLLSLDDSLHHWLPAYENIDSTVTIRQLLGHRSGVNDYLNENPATWNALISDFSAYWSPEKILSYVLPENFPPGTLGRYSNTGYILAGMIIKAATGDTSFTQTLHSEILDPLNLTYTMVDIEEPLVADLAHGWFDYDEDKIREDVFEHPRTAFWSGYWTAGAILATAKDLCDFTWHNYRGDILNQTSLEAMFDFKPVQISYNWEDYGLGVVKQNMLGEEIYCHSGNAGWYSAFTTYFPKYDISISVLVNQEPVDLVPPNFGSRYAAIELFRVILEYFKFPYDKVYPYNSVSKTHNITGSHFQAKVHLNNPNNHSVELWAYLINKTDGTIADSTQLALADSTLYGGFLKIPLLEDNFSLTYKSVDLVSGYVHTLSDVDNFTTKGPVEYLAYRVGNDTILNPETHPGDRFSFHLLMYNAGKSSILNGIKIKAKSLDPAINVYRNESVPMNIGPSETTWFQAGLGIIVSDTAKTAEYPIQLDIYKDDQLTWIDTMYLAVNDGTVDITELQTSSVSLQQNFPNPFTHSSHIVYQLPTQTKVQLTVYDVTGRRVRTLVNQQQQGGYHQELFDASGLQSGIYIYELRTEESVQSRRMLKN
ncbi:serine hydrolase [Maribellus mangrovi]|uniref:serine hydrolase n=1 Tax=Maribellus mangrovi TaxID=3133146 RepID=UPI0030ED648F